MDPPRGRLMTALLLAFPLGVSSCLLLALALGGLAL